MAAGLYMIYSDILRGNWETVC